MAPPANSNNNNEGPRSAYLYVYNVTCCLLWIVVMAQVALHFYRGLPVATLYAYVSTVLLLAQSLALLEVVHSILGVVASNPMSTLMQVSSRLMLVYGVIYIIPTSREHWEFVLMILSWAAVEIPRYAFYAKNLSGDMPYPLLWVRYSLFMILYPSGISGELLCMYRGLDYASKTGLLTYSMPNAWNFSFSYYYFLLAVMAIYVPGSPHMYFHMLALRKKNLSSPAKTARDKRD